MLSSIPLISEGQNLNVTGYTYSGYTGPTNGNGVPESALSGTAYYINNPPLLSSLPVSSLFNSNTTPITSAGFLQPYLTETGTYSGQFNTSTAGGIDYGSGLILGVSLSGFLNPSGSLLNTVFNLLDGISINLDLNSPLALELTGTIDITKPNTVATFNVAGDEAYGLYVGNQSVTGVGNSGTDTFTFATPGDYTLVLELVNTSLLGSVDTSFGATANSYTIDTTSGEEVIGSAAVPEPSTMNLLMAVAGGLAGFFFLKRRAIHAA